MTLLKLDITTTSRPQKPAIYRRGWRFRIENFKSKLF